MCSLLLRWTSRGELPGVVLGEGVARFVLHSGGDGRLVETFGKAASRIEGSLLGGLCLFIRNIPRNRHVAGGLHLHQLEGAIGKRVRVYAGPFFEEGCGDVGSGGY